MKRYITEAVLYNSWGMEIDRQEVASDDIMGSLAKLLAPGTGWILNEGDTIKIVSREVA